MNKKEKKSSSVMKVAQQEKDQLEGNIKYVLDRYYNASTYALFLEKEYIEICNDYEVLLGAAENVSVMVLEFLKEKGLTEEFREFSKKRNTGVFERNVIPD